MSAFLYCNECNVINGNQLEKLEAAKAAWPVWLFLLGLTGSLRVLLGPSGPYLASLGLIGPYWALLGLTGPYWALLGLTGLYWTLLGLTEPYWALLGLVGPYFAFTHWLTNWLTDPLTNGHYDLLGCFRPVQSIPSDCSPGERRASLLPMLVPVVTSTRQRWRSHQPVWKWFGIGVEILKWMRIGRLTSWRQSKLFVWPIELQTNLREVWGLIITYKALSGVG